MKISMRIRPPYIHGDGCSQCRDYISTHASYRNAHRSIGRFDREHAAVLRVYEFRVYYWGTHFRIGGIAGIIWSTDIFINTGWNSFDRCSRFFFGIDVSRDDYDRRFFFFLIWTFRRFGFNLTRWTGEYIYIYFRKVLFVNEWFSEWLI